MVEFQSSLRLTETIRLGPRDSLRFAQALISPPAPNPALRRAFARHRRLVCPAMPPRR